jgi:UPF0042 nucleotide-binding protein
MSTQPTIHLYSFGYKHTGIPAPFVGSHIDGAGGGFVFDCRALPNPYWEEALRQYNGLDQPILEFMARAPEADGFARNVAEMVLGAARSYREQEKPVLRVAFGCTGGRHRSVWQAERLREALEAAGFAVTVEHLDIDRGLEDQPGTPDPRKR